MPHLIKEYSKNLGVEPNKPVVNKHFFPIKTDNYIVIYNEQDIQSKNYNYYRLVIDLIRSSLIGRGIDVVVIGSDKNVARNADHFYCNLDFRKNCYIISKAKLLVSIDNALTQYASSEGVPVVNLYGNIYSSITSPYWGKKNQKENLEPKWDKKPCLSLVDSKESIDTIAPEKVATSILKLLGFDDYNNLNFKTILPNKIKKEEIDIIPTEYVNLGFSNESILNIRLDCCDSVDTGSFMSYCSNHKCNIISKNLVLQADVIQKIADNLNCITIIVDEPLEAIPKEYFNLLKKLKIHFLMLVKDKSLLDDLRLEYFDQSVEFYNPAKEKPELVNLNHKFISFKSVIEGSKVYKSVAHWKKGLDSSNNVVDNPTYWEELDYFYIYEQDRTEGKTS
tara:strand:+ start:789 stop:1967 length:1179 start_codon:yes stop_codon:yes gene_type:complete